MQSLARIIPERFCCNRQSAATTCLRPAGSPLGPSPYCTSTHRGLRAPRAGLAPPPSPSPMLWEREWRGTTNHHESCGLGLEDHHPIVFAFFFQEHLDLFFS